MEREVERKKWRRSNLPSRFGTKEHLKPAGQKKFLPLFQLLSIKKEPYEKS